MPRGWWCKLQHTPQGGSAQLGRFWALRINHAHCAPRLASTPGRSQSRLTFKRSPNLWPGPRPSRQGGLPACKSGSGVILSQAVPERILLILSATLRLAIASLAGSVLATSVSAQPLWFPNADYVLPRMVPDGLTHRLPLQSVPSPTAAAPSPAMPSVRGFEKQPGHAFWDRQNLYLFSAVAVSRGLDYSSTLNMRRRGRQEILLTNDVVDNHRAFAAIEVAAVVVSIGASYLFHRYHHHRLERWTSIVHAGLATTGAVRNYCLETAHPLSEPSSAP